MRIFWIVAAFILTACTTIDINEHCRYSQSNPINKANPDSLALLVGMPPGRMTDSNFVVLHSPSQASSEVVVKLTTTPGAYSLPADLDESKCAGVDWNSYSLSVDPEEWESFWTNDRASTFEIGIAFLNDSRPLRFDSLGIAVIDTDTSEYLVSCGCYWE